MTSRELLHDKFHLEALLHKEPFDLRIRHAYFAKLLMLSRSGFGVFHVSLPEIARPIAVRANTSDVFNLRQIFLSQEYDIAFPSDPRRILDLGAYAGYAAIYFANRFPNSQVVCIEPSNANFAILSTNVQGYSNIRVIHGAVWHRPTFLSLSGYEGGYWGATFSEKTGTPSELVQAYTVPEILDSLGWADLDLLKCDIEGGELELFSGPSASEWIDRVMTVSIETHDRFRPGSTSAVENAFPSRLFSKHQSGEFRIYRRLTAQKVAIAGEPADRIELFPNNGRLVTFELSNVPPQDWGFMIINNRMFQLHPPPLSKGPSQIAFDLELRRHRRFKAICHLAGNGSGNVTFSFCLIAGNEQLAVQNWTLKPGVREHVELAFPEHSGPCKLILGTQMAPAANGNGRAWARWEQAVVE